MTKPKILIVASVASMIEQFNMPNIELLQNMGYEVHVACNFIDGGTIPSEKAQALKKKLNILKVFYHQIDFNRNAFNLVQNYKAYKQLKYVFTYNFDIVHSHSPIGGVLARLIGNKYRKEGLISIYTAHGFHFYKGAPIKNWMIFYPIEKILSRITDKLVTINKEDYEISKKKFNAKEILYIPGIGINLEKFYPLKNKTKSTLRESLGYKKEDFILIYIAELSHRKNQKMLLEAINDIKNKIPELKLLLIGTGPLETEYKKIVEKRKMQEDVDFLGYRNDVVKLMGIADVAVSTSRQEGLPVNVMEAMAMGLPLIVTDARGNNDLISNTRNGYVVTLDNNDQLTESLVEVYNSEKLRKRFSKNNLKDIDKYSLVNILIELKRIYTL